MTATASQADRFSPLVLSAAVVLLNFNFSDRRDIPGGITWVTEDPRSEKPKHEPGRRIDEGRDVSMIGLLRELLGEGFIPVSLQAVDRKCGRVSAVLVRGDRFVDGQCVMSFADRVRLEEILTSFNADVRIYRNPGEDGGNFSVECGNLKLGHASKLILGITDEGELAICEAE